MATQISEEEVLPPFLNSNSDPPALFDGTTRLYMTYYCPFAHRAWLTRNYKGLHSKIQLVPIDLEDKPAWYKEKINPSNTVPALEHDNKIIGESLDLIKYIDTNFEGPSLFPDDPDQKEFTEELFVYSSKWNPPIINYLKGTTSEDEMRASFDILEDFLSKYNHEGPFLLGAQFSAADLVYAPFVHRYYYVYMDVHKYDITEGRPKLAAWRKALDTVVAFRETRWDDEQNVKIFKRRTLVELWPDMENFT